MRSIENYEGSITVTNVTGATDLSGKHRRNQGNTILLPHWLSLILKSHFLIAQKPPLTLTRVSINAKGGIVVSIRRM